MSYEDKPVEQWSPREYDDFWANYVREIKIIECKICGDELRGRDISGHMERKHDEKYEEHNEKLEDAPEPRPEKKLNELEGSP